MNKNNIVFAAKCAPNEKAFFDIKKAGLDAVELYIDSPMLEKVNQTAAICAKVPLRYAIHAPVFGYHPKALRDLAEAIKAEIIVCHNIYWEDEWQEIVEIFNGSNVKLCIENTFSAHEPIKFMRRYHMGMCLDIEHIQMECAGVYEDPFVKIMGQASHIHMTGYVYGSQLWHTPIHYSPEHNRMLLGLLVRSGYSGLVVSEADQRFQTLEEFRRLSDFYKGWQNE